MDEVWWWIMDIIGPAILLILLIWLVFRQRASKKDREITYKGTKAEYADEERRRREGTDGD